MTPQELKEFRTSINLTQKEFAEKVGVSRRETIAEYENGKRNIPGWLAKMVPLLKIKIVSSQR